MNSGIKLVGLEDICCWPEYSWGRAEVLRVKGEGFPKGNFVKNRDIPPVRQSETWAIKHSCHKQWRLLMHANGRPPPAFLLVDGKQSHDMAKFKKKKKQKIRDGYWERGCYIHQQKHSTEGHSKKFPFPNATPVGKGGRWEPFACLKCFWCICQWV